LIEYDGEIILFSQSGNTMTHSEHTGRGLFFESAKLTFDYCKNEKIKGVFGFPSKSSFLTFKKGLNWKFYGFIQNYSIFVFTIPFGILFSRFSFLRKIYRLWVSFILFFYKKGKPFESSIKYAKQNGVLRDLNFWKYKLQNEEIRLIQISGIDVVLKFNGSILVGDINFEKKFNFPLFLFKLKLLAFFSFSLYLKFYTSKGTLLDFNLSKKYLSKDGLPIGICSFDHLKTFDNLKFNFFDFDTF
jgi:hypothetical protein